MVISLSITVGWLQARLLRNLTLVTVLVANAAAAQEVTSVSPSRIHISERDIAKIEVGLVRKYSGNETPWIPLAETRITPLEMQPTDSGLVEAGLIGAVAGALVGVGWILVDNVIHEKRCPFDCVVYRVGGGAAIGAVVGLTWFRITHKGSRSRLGPLFRP